MGGREEKGERLLAQGRLFIYVAIYLNKVHFINWLLLKFLIYNSDIFTDLEITFLDFNNSFTTFHIYSHLCSALKIIKNYEERIG